MRSATESSLPLEQNFLAMHAKSCDDVPKAFTYVRFVKSTAEWCLCFLPEHMPFIPLPLCNWNEVFGPGMLRRVVSHFALTLWASGLQAVIVQVVVTCVEHYDHHHTSGNLSCLHLQLLQLGIAHRCGYMEVLYVNAHEEPLPSVQKDLTPLLRELGIGIVPYSPLGRGFLTSSITKLADLSPDDRRRYLYLYLQKIQVKQQDNLW